MVAETVLHLKLFRGGGGCHRWYDTISTGTGVDDITSGSGADTITVGAGTDNIVTLAAALGGTAMDVITDWTSGTVEIEIDIDEVGAAAANRQISTI